MLVFFFNIKFMVLKYVVQWVLVYFQDGQLSPQSNLRTYSSPPNRNPIPVSQSVFASYEPDTPLTEIFISTPVSLEAFPILLE